MKRIYLGLWLMAGMANSSSAELTLTKSTAANREILIRVSNANNIPGSILLPAQGVASRILAQAGIQVRWVKTADSEPATEMNGCRDRHLNVIDMAFVVKAPANQRFVLATAAPYASGGVRIHVFWDRILDAHPADGPPVQRSLLGHVLAHEIGHVLIGSQEHSPAGLMKAAWTNFELGSMRAGPLPIAKQDTEAMLRNLDAASIGCAPASNLAVASK